jgi:hypothetical protein
MVLSDTESMKSGTETRFMLGLGDGLGVVQILGHASGRFHLFPT